VPGGVVQLVAYLRCPTCGEALANGAALVRCPAGHSFDLARQGYVDLSGGRVTHAGDTTAMVQARAALLGAGHFRPLADAIVAAARVYAPADPGLIVDVGAGTGYYVAALLQAYPRGLGLALDVAKPALRRAATAHPRLAAVRADAWRRLPVADAAAGLVLDVFAPRSGPEFHRILQPDGVLIVVTPTPEHLRELAEPGTLLAVDPAKEERLAATLEAWFDLTGRQPHTWQLSLTRTEAQALIGMGPNARHGDPAGLAATLPQPATVTASVQLTVWRPRPHP
jgi:23S rRNA (guanine745-N1)-methyltransferase